MTSVGYGEEKIRCANLKGKRVACNNNIFIGNGISDKSCINYDNSPSVEFSEDDIQGKVCRMALAKALADGINSRLVELEDFGGIEEVHFTSFVLQ